MSRDRTDELVKQINLWLDFQWTDKDAALRAAEWLLRETLSEIRLLRDAPPPVGPSYTNIIDELDSVLRGLFDEPRDKDDDRRR